MKVVMLVVLSLVSGLSFANRDFLVDSDWLAEHIEDKNLVLLEVRYHPHRYLTIGHIPGAKQVKRFADLGDNDANPIMRFPDQDKFQKTLRAWGGK